jgi:hypothetical protein
VIDPALAPEGVHADNAGTLIEWLINRGTERIRKAANAISLKDYSSFLRSKDAPP